MNEFMNGQGKLLAILLGVMTLQLIDIHINSLWFTIPVFFAVGYFVQNMTRWIKTDD